MRVLVRLKSSTSFPLEMIIDVEVRSLKVRIEDDGVRSFVPKLSRVQYLSLKPRRTHKLPLHPQQRCCPSDQLCGLAIILSFPVKPKGKPPCFHIPQTTPALFTLAGMLGRPQMTMSVRAPANNRRWSPRFLRFLVRETRKGTHYSFTVAT